MARNHKNPQEPPCTNIKGY